MKEVEVAAAVFQQQMPGSGKATLAMRRSSGAMKGFWEFPGGKREPGESLQGCLVREIKEELDVSITVGSLLDVNHHASASRVIVLHAFHVSEWSGVIKLIDHDQMQWLEAAALHSVDWAPADLPFVDILAQA